LDQVAGEGVTGIRLGIVVLVVAVLDLLGDQKEVAVGQAAEGLAADLTGEEDQLLEHVEHWLDAAVGQVAPSRVAPPDAYDVDGLAVDLLALRAREAVPHVVLAAGAELVDAEHLPLEVADVLKQLRVLAGGLGRAHQVELGCHREVEAHGSEQLGLASDVAPQGTDELQRLWRPVHPVQREAVLVEDRADVSIVVLDADGELASRQAGADERAGEVVLPDVVVVIPHLLLPASTDRTATRST
jgi:hypothetical protein